MIALLTLLGISSTAFAQSADAGGPYEVDAEDTVELDAGDSSEGSCWYIYYQWDLDDDGTADTSWSEDPTTDFDAAGYDGEDTETVEVSMACYYYWSWYTYTDEATVTINNVAPEIKGVTADISLKEGEEGDFSVSYSDVESADTHTVTWDWDDGTSDTGDSASHTWDDDGSYTVTVTVTDDDGDEDESTSTVTVNNVSPTIDSATIPSSGDEGESLSFEVSASDPGVNDTLSYAWQFGDGSTGTGASVSHTYTDDGDYTVVVVVSDEDGGSRSTSGDVEIANVDPTIDDTDIPTSGDEGEDLDMSVTVSDAGDDDTLVVTWDFGDGETASGTDVTHTYEDDGDYTVTITVTDDDGGTDTTSTTVEIDNKDPKIDSSSFGEGDEGEALSFSATASDAGSDDTLSFSWDFGDGETATGPSVEHTYTDDDRYTVTVTVTDDDGGSKSKSKNIDVDNVAPTVSLSGDVSGSEGDTLSWSVDVDDPGTDDTHTYSWNFGDGTTSSDSGSASHTYDDSGSYTVTVTVTDDDGGASSDTIDVVIADNPPSVTSLTGDSSGDEGDTLTWSCAGEDFEGGSVSYAWDYGDGDTSTGATGSHVYADDGDYTVTCTVTDSGGSTANDTIDVVIDNVAPVIALSSYDTSPDEGDTVSFDVVATDAGSDDTLSYSWDFGDGSTATGASTTHSYADDGSYALVLTVTDDDGDSVTETATIGVLNVDPTATASGDTTGSEGDTLSFSVDVSDPGDDTFTYTWDFGDGETGSGTDVDHTFDEDGTYTVSVTVEDDDGGSGTDELTVVISNVAPVISGISGDNSGDEGDTLSLVCSSSDAGSADSLTTTWDFGDGETATGSSVTHAWGDDGEFEVSCTVSDGTDSDTATTTVTLENVAPTLSGSPDETATEGTEYSFVPTMSDPGADDTHSWALDGLDDADVDASTGEVTWTPGYDDVGSYDLTLSVEDDDGAAAELSWTVTVDFLDSDGDGLADTWEDAYGLDPDDASDASADGDGDGRTNLDEFENGWDPTVYEGPGVPTLVSPEDGTEIDTDQPGLEVENAEAPLDQTLTYSFWVYSDSALSTLVASTEGELAGTSSTSWIADVTLDENTWYWWTAAATDDYTVGDAADPFEFFVNTVNEAPDAPVLSAPFDGGSASSLTPDLVLDEVADPDLDAVTYTVVITDLDGIEVASTTELEGDGSQASWTLPEALIDNEEYCWTAYATDEHGLDGAWADEACFLVDLSNEAPTAPEILAPTDGEALTSWTPTIEVVNGEDPERRSTQHHFAVYLDGDTTAEPVATAAVDTEDGSETTAWTVTPELAEDQWYSVRVLCTDGSLDSDADEVEFFVSTVNDAPSVPSLFNPSDGAAYGDSDALVVLNAEDPEGDALTYVIEVRTRGGEVVATSEDLEEGSDGTTAWAPGSLDNGIYLWTAWAIDAEGLESDEADPRFLIVGDGWSDTGEPATGDTGGDVGADDGLVGDGGDKVGCGCAAGPATPRGLVVLGVGLLGLLVRRRR